MPHLSPHTCTDARRSGHAFNPPRRQHTRGRTNSGSPIQNLWAQITHVEYIMWYYNTVVEYGIILEKKSQKMFKPGASTHPTAEARSWKDPSDPVIQPLHITLKSLPTLHAHAPTLRTPEHC